MTMASSTTTTTTTTAATRPPYYPSSPPHDPSAISSRDAASHLAALGPPQEEEAGRPDRTYLPVYSRFSPTQKRSITALLAFGGLLSTMSTTSVLAAVPEVVREFDTTATVVSVSNALYLLFMGLAASLWGPSADIFGRRTAYLCSTVTFFAFSLGTALAKNIVAFFVCRILTAASGIAFLILGSTCLSDIYHPRERATAIGWFLAGSMIGPAFGPLVGGAIVTKTSWRIIFWLQTAMAGCAMLLTYFLLHETLHKLRATELQNMSTVEAARKLWRWTNPSVVVKLFLHKNLCLVMLASSSLVWNMYSLLTPVRYVLNPRLNLTTPLESGLLFIAPGAGYMVGVQIGGRWADFTVRRWMAKRGYRRPEDRLRSSLFFLGGLLPGSMLLYGWMIDKRLGGVPVPVVCMFLQGLAQTAAFASLNAYILDAMQHRSGEASAAHYMMRYSFAGVSTALCLPLIDKIGVGWTSTVSAVLLLISAGLVVWTLHAGEGWRAARSDAETQMQQGTRSAGGGAVVGNQRDS